MLEKFTREEAATYLTKALRKRITYSALCGYATRETGPMYKVIFNKAIYLKKDLDLWVHNKLNP